MDYFPRYGLLMASALAGMAPSFAQQAPVRSQVTAQVSVTTTRSSVGSGESARTSFELDSEKLSQYPAVTLDEALRQHAGFELFRRSSSRVQNPTSQGISLRGLGSTAASRTLVLEEGAPLNDAFGGWIHWNENPAGTVERVTLVSGGGSDLYGSSALGGVIDVVPIRPEHKTFDLLASGGTQFTRDISGIGSWSGRSLEELVAVEVLRNGGYVQVAPELAGPVDIPSNVHGEAVRMELAKRMFNSSRVSVNGNVLNEARGNGTPFQTNATRLWRYSGGYSTPVDRRLTVRARGFGSDEGYRQSFSSISSTRSVDSLTRRQHVKAQEIGGTGGRYVTIWQVCGCCRRRCARYPSDR